MERFSFSECLQALGVEGLFFRKGNANLKPSPRGSERRLCWIRLSAQPRFASSTCQLAGEGLCRIVQTAMQVFAAVDAEFRLYVKAWEAMMYPSPTLILRPVYYSLQSFIFDAGSLSPTSTTLNPVSCRFELSSKRGRLGLRERRQS